MDNQLTVLRIIHAAMLFAAAFYVWMAEVFMQRSDSVISTVAYAVLVLMAAWAVAGMFIMRPRTLDRGAELLQANSNDLAAIKQWRTGYLIMLASSEAVVLYGFLVRFWGGSLTQAVPFYAVGILLLFLFYPRRP